MAGDTGTAASVMAQLESVGYESRHLSHGTEQPGADAEGSDALLLDVPRGGVAQAVTAYHRLRASTVIPVVLMIEESDEAELRATGLGEPHGHIVRPFGARELRATIELALCRREARQAVRELEDRFFSTSLDMLCFLDFNGYFRRLNPAWERTLGFTREELMSRPFIEFVHPDDRERTLAQNARVRAGGRAEGFENRYLCRDGSFRWLHWKAAPDFGEHVIYSAARDVTESKRIAEEREQLVRELRDALAEVKTLRSILPICSYCRKIHDDEDKWETIEVYLARHTESRFSHSICPSCMASVVEPQLKEMEGS